MKYIGLFFTALYEVFILLPILLAATIFTSLFTCLTIPWKNSALVHWVQQMWSRLFYWLTFTNYQIEGTENIQKGQSYVFVCNHQSLFDVWIIYGWLPCVYKWVMKQELRKVPFVGTACKAAGHIFIERKNARAAKESLEEAKRTLVNGVSVVIFPEGTRSKDGEIHEFKRGAFSVAFEMGLPVIPITLCGINNLMPKGSWIFKPFTKVKMTIGQPIDLHQFLVTDNPDAPTLKKEQLEAMTFVRERMLEAKEW